MRKLYKSKLTVFIALILLFSAISISAQTVENTFNPNYIIGDSEILDTTSMSLAEITQFLNSKEGYLATYKTTSPDGKTMSAAEIIYDRAITNGVNPKFLIVLLQKEGSLIEKKNPSQIALDWAVGYGCFDNSPCNPRWQGFWKQINSASLQFRDYMDNPHLYNYRPNQTYTISNTGRDPMVVTPLNLATSALYNYTPHVYNGNYNFYVIWQRYFSRNAVYPNGSLLQADNDPVVYLIQDGKKRPFTSKGALTSRYDTKKIIKVSKTDLAQYSLGNPIKFAQYSLVRSPAGSIYLIVDDTRRGFTSQLAFKKVGLNPEEIINASWADITPYKEVAAITATSTHATGSLLQNNKTGGVYWVIDGKKSAILDAIFLKTKFKYKKITAVTPKELDKYPTTTPILFNDGELVKSPISNAIYIIADGKKNPIISGEIFEKLGYKWENILTVSPKVLYLYPEGAPINKVPNATPTEEQTIALTATTTATSTLTKI
ncbi:MAG: hypothetical protein US81_C0019G0006 [Parcubacteria group bacterium GW2011_GWE2_38_18]|nr:MAG: hypothetical protein US81_C0019G0006 [Parcubacteria group bacterium GW2011_GWE2_38_18]